MAVALRLGKKTYALKLTFGGARTFKRLYGETIYRTIRRSGDGEEMAFDQDWITHALLACLVHEHPKLDVDQVAALIDQHIDAGGEMGDVCTALTLAFREASRAVLGVDLSKAEGQGLGEEGKGEPAPTGTPAS